jgi:thiol-disulfide isomerase/thioredoxin
VRKALALVVLCLGLIGLAGMLTSCFLFSNPYDDAIGTSAFNFTLADLDGNDVSLNDFRGQPVFINFWASWCGPCRDEMPDMEEVYQKYKDAGLVILGVNIEEAEADVRQFVLEGGYSWTFLLDSEAQVADLYDVNGIPSSFFIDKDGIIRDAHRGTLSVSRMETKLETIME